MKRLLTTSLTCGVLIAFAEPARAQFGGFGNMFDRFDQDGDGVITSEELPNSRAAGFFQNMGLDLERGVRRDELEEAMRSGMRGMGGRGRDNGRGRGDDDANRSRSRGFGRFGGASSRLGPVAGPDDAQARERAERIAQRLIERNDQNDDGVLAFDEIPDRLREDVARLDSNGDGILGADELANRYAPPQGSDTRDRSPNAQQAPFRFRTGPSYPAGLPSWFQQSDGNRDGQVAMYEWDRRQLAEFQNYDVNDDGFITAEEAIRSNRRGTAGTAFGPNTFGSRATPGSRPTFGSRGGFGDRGGGRTGFQGRSDSDDRRNFGARWRGFRGRSGRNGNR